MDIASSCLLTYSGEQVHGDPSPVQCPFGGAQVLLCRRKRRQHQGGLVEEDALVGIHLGRAEEEGALRQAGA